MSWRTSEDNAMEMHTKTSLCDKDKMKWWDLWREGEQDERKRRGGLWKMRLEVLPAEGTAVAAAVNQEKDKKNVNRW